MANREGSRVTRGIAVTIALIVAACGGAQPSTTASRTLAPAATAAATDPLAELYSDAKAEGALTVLGAADEPYMSQLFKSFKSKYPGIEPSFVQQSAGNAAQLVLTAVEAGKKPLADVMLNKYQIVRPLLDRNALDTKTDWRRYGVPDKIVFPVDGAVVELAQPYGLAYNTTHVKPEDLPRTWEALVDAKWQGKFAVVSNGGPWDILSSSLGEQATLDYVRRLTNATKPIIIPGGCCTSLLQGLIAGDYAVAPATFYAVEALKASGAPIAWSPVDPVIVDQTAWWLTGNSDHPNAARLFVAWQTARDAQDIAHSFFRSNALSADVPSSYRQVIPSTRDQFTTVANTATSVTKFLAGVGK